MTVKPGLAEFVGGGRPEASGNVDDQVPPREMGSVSMANPWYVAAFAILLWLTVSVLNVANLVLLGLGK